MSKEFWELTLPSQAKWRVELLETALDRFEGKVVATHTSKGYSPWRAPKVFKIALPAGQRMKFIQHCVAHNKSGTGFHWWLRHPARLEVPCNEPEPMITPIAFARIDRDALSQVKRRNYSLGMRAADSYIWDYHPVRGRKKLYGDDALRFIDGEMDLLLGDRP